MLDLQSNEYQLKQLCRGSWDASTSDCADIDSNYNEQLITELIEISGAPLNVYPLLGIHNQGGLIDLTGKGRPLSSATLTNPKFMFDNDPDTSWVSESTGFDVAAGKTFIGYDFGTKKQKSGVEKYAPSAPIRFSVRTIKIHQTGDINSKVAQLRVEQSDDGINWKRVDVINIPTTDLLETVGIKQAPPARFWRLIPTMFIGSLSPDSRWIVGRLQLMNDTQTSLDDIEDPIFMENMDARYATVSYRIKCYYDLNAPSINLLKFGISLSDQYEFLIPFNRMIEIFGRPLVIGDMIELPGEMQYNHKLRGVLKWLEVADTSWATQGFTLNWKSVLFRVTAKPVTFTSTKHRDLFGTPTEVLDLGDNEFIDDKQQFTMVPHMLSDTIAALAADAVPERGQDATTIAQGVSAVGCPSDQKDLYVEDGLPPNGEDFTEGPTWPLKPSDGDYHRLTYPELDLATALYRYSSRKKDWIYQETDRRAAYISHKPTANRFMKHGIPLKDI